MPAPNRLRRFASEMRPTLARFPLTFAFLVPLAVLFLGEIHGFLHFSGEDLIHARLACFFALGALAATLARFVQHPRGWPERDYVRLTALMALPIGLLCALAPGFGWHALFLGAGLAVLLVPAPDTGRGSGSEACCSHAGSIAVSAAVAVAATLILCGGLSAALASVAYLFDLDLGERWYLDIWTLGLILFAPAYCLATMPRAYSAAGGTPYPAAVTFIVRRILCPLVLLYLVILYAYIAKILLQWQLPQGNIGWMVAGFGSIGVLAHFLAYPLRETGGLTGLVVRWFYPALLLPTAMLWVAAAVRLRAYGVTEERYLLALLALWFTAAGLLFTLRPAARLAVVPLLLGAFLVLASFGPWGAVYRSASSQIERLETLLARNSMLQDGRLVPAGPDVPAADRSRMASIFHYLANHSHDWRIAAWVPERTPGNPWSRMQTYEMLQRLRLTNVSDPAVAPARPTSTLPDTMRPIELRLRDDVMHLAPKVTGFDYVAEGRLAMREPSVRQVRSDHDLQLSPRRSVAVEFLAGQEAVRVAFFQADPNQPVARFIFPLGPTLARLDDAALPGGVVPPEQAERMVLRQRKEGYGIDLQLLQIRYDRAAGVDAPRPTSLNYRLLMDVP